MHDTEKKYEIIRLAEFVAKRESLPAYTEHRVGRLGVIVNGGAYTIRLHPSGDDAGWGYEIVYQTQRDHQAEENSINREMDRLGIDMRGGRKIYSETEWNPQFADETLLILQQATVLDQLADL